MSDLTVADLHKSTWFLSSVICLPIRQIKHKLDPPTVKRTFASQFMANSCSIKFSEAWQEARYDFERIKFVLNVHTDVTDRKSRASNASYSSDNVAPHQHCCIRSICFLYTLPLSIITEARSLMLGQFKKLSRFTLHSVLHSKQHLTYNLKRSLILSKVLSYMARRAAIHVPLTRRIIKMLFYL